jgi:hypothetical protein
MPPGQSDNGVFAMRYTISYNTLSKAVLGVLGAGPGRSGVEVDGDAIRARVGRAGTVTIPRASIVAIERVDRVPWWLGYGMHGGFGGTWALNGSSSGAVKLTMREPATGKVTGFSVRPRTIYFSLDDPEGFVADVAPARDA